VLNGKSFGNGVVLMGMPVVEVRPLFTIFQGLKAGFVAVDLVFACMLFVIVVLFATAVAIDSSSLSLLLVCARSCWLDIIAFRFVFALCLGLLLLSTITGGACVVLFVFCCSVARFA